MITKFEEQLSEQNGKLEMSNCTYWLSNSPIAQSTTPTGTPPQSAVALATNVSAPVVPAAPQNVSDILKGLASFAPNHATPQGLAPVSTPPQNMPAQAPYMQNMPNSGTPISFPAVGVQQPNMNGATQNNPLAALLVALEYILW